jgi:cyclopropane-fatty-acyl-phospholipid synthase
MFLMGGLKALWRTGHLIVIDANGREYSFGNRADRPHVVVRLHDGWLNFKLALNPKLYVGEAYVDGTLTIETGTLYDFLDICTANLVDFEGHPAQAVYEKLCYLGRRFQQANPVRKSRDNVAPHYDAADSIAHLFLDSDLQYTCAYFHSLEDDLDTAQQAKKRHLAAKLRLEPGLKVLDIGCGWGGLALSLARAADVHVTGVTLSPNQWKTASERAERAGLSDRVRFELRDVRTLDEQFDRIVAVGVVEHLGVRHYPEFFGTVRERLADNGVALLHSLGRIDGSGTSNAWGRKYIFPGAYVPALSEVFPAVENSSLFVADVEILRLHYAQTVEHWYRKFKANREQVKEMHGEKFCRLWEFYLIGSAMFMRQCNLMNFQMQFAKQLQTLPLTRDYMIEAERAYSLESFSAC